MNASKQQLVSHQGDTRPEVSQELVAAEHRSSLIGTNDESQMVRLHGDVPSALPGLAVVQVG